MNRKLNDPTLQPFFDDIVKTVDDIRANKLLSNASERAPKLIREAAAKAVSAKAALKARAAGLAADKAAFAEKTRELREAYEELRALVAPEVFAARS